MSDERRNEAREEGKGGSLPLCAICHIQVALYRCPRCHTCTCSLACCRVHKEGTDGNSIPMDGTSSRKRMIICNGKRDRTQFCSLKSFTDSQLSSDYHFLEDVLKVSDRSKRLYQDIVTTRGESRLPGKPTRGAVSTMSNGPNSKRILELESISNMPPIHPLLRAKEGKGITAILVNSIDEDNACEQQEGGIFADSLSTSNLNNDNIPTTSTRLLTKQMNVRENGTVDALVRQAELKGVNVLRMPCGMMRRTSNTSRFNKKKGTILWKIELIFHLPTKKFDDNNEDGEGGGAHKLCSLATSSTTPKHFRVESELSESCTLYSELGKHLDVHPGNAARRSCLRDFVNTPRDTLSLFMKRIPCSSASPIYFRLDPNSSLTEVLKGKTIIEFPTIDVVTDSDKERFPLFIKDCS